MADQPDPESCAEFLRALGDPLRLQIVEALQAGPLAVTDIAELLECDVAKASHHLRTLYHAQLVETDRQGRFTYYRLSQKFYSNSRGKGLLNFGCCRFELPADPST